MAAGNRKKSGGISRRQFLAAASPLSLGGAGALAGCVSAGDKAPVSSHAVQSGFTHGLASGDPDASSLLLWTRYLPTDGQAATLQWEVATDPGFTGIIARGNVQADPARDYCAKAVAGGLPADSRVYYRFRAPDGVLSGIGRGRTLPASGRRTMKLAVFSCANIGFGYFNAYGHAAAREDLDLLLHLGDYIYEYGDKAYPSPTQRAPGRQGLQPDHEIVALADYRQRYAFYRRDPDLQALHAAHSMMAVWDDHEFANDAWRGGAQNHQAATEGEWNARRAAARQAYYEWLPIRDAEHLYRSVKLGDLADLLLLDTRIEGRDAPAALPRGLIDNPPGSPAYLAALDGYRAALEKPDRHLLGSRQQDWLAAGLEASARRGATWQILAQQIVFGERRYPPAVVEKLPESASQALRSGLARSADLHMRGISPSRDSWPGYVAERRWLLDQAGRPGRRVVMLSGDTHNAWAFAHGPHFIECATPAVTSPGMEASVPLPPADLAALMRASSPGMLWCDTGRRGYLDLTLSAEGCTAQWRLLDTIREHRSRMAAEPALYFAVLPDGIRAPAA